VAQKRTRILQPGVHRGLRVLISVFLLSLAVAGYAASELDYRYVSIAHLWIDVFQDFPDDYAEKLRPILLEIKSFGFKGVSVHTNYFLDTASHSVFPNHDSENAMHPWMYSPEDWMLEELLKCIRDVGLDADLRITLLVPGDEFGRFDYSPRATGVDRFFASYGELALRLARILERTSGDVFTVFNELPMIEDHSERVRNLLDDVATVFGGELLVCQNTHHLIRDFPEIYRSGDLARYEAYSGDYWNWQSSDGRALIIAYNWWPDSPPIAYSANLETMTQEIVDKWGNMVAYHRTTYPGHLIVFGEVGIYNEGTERMANSWQAYLSAMERMDVDGFAIWSIQIDHWAWHGEPGPVTHGQSEISGEPVISAITPFLD